MTFMHLPFDKMFANKSSENKKGMQFQKGVHDGKFLLKGKCSYYVKIVNFKNSGPKFSH